MVAELKLYMRSFVAECTRACLTEFFQQSRISRFRNIFLHCYVVDSAKRAQQGSEIYHGVYSETMRKQQISVTI